ncbi:MAG: CBS domain-containing protein [Candidatus Bathyarchaeia archaeon]|jgi:predicted transcriptional regulator
MKNHKKVVKGTNLFLPNLEDLLRFIKYWCEETGVSKSELARQLDVHRSQISQLFNGRRGLHYDEAETILDYLNQRLSRLPQEPVGTFFPPRKLERIQTSDTVGEAARKMAKGNFTQVPVYDGDNYFGLVTDRMLVERLLRPNIPFRDNWPDELRKTSVRKANVTEASAVYPPEASISSVAHALTEFYAVMIGDPVPNNIVTRWDYLKLLKPR